MAKRKDKRAATWTATYAIRADVPLDVATEIDVLRGEWQKLSIAAQGIKALLPAAFCDSLDHLFTVAAVSGPQPSTLNPGTSQ